MRMICAGLALLLLLALGQSVLAEEAKMTWSPVQGALPAGLSGPAVESGELTAANPLLRLVCDELYEVPWAPGEAVLLEPSPQAGGLTAFGFWRSETEYHLLVRQGRRWQVVTPSGAARAREPRLAYYGHDASGQAVEWTGPAKAIAVGPAGAEGLQVTRVPLFEAGCVLMTLKRAERELDQARDFLGWMRPAPAELLSRVDDCQGMIDATRARLDRETGGLLATYEALPEPRYALENLAYFSRLYHRRDRFGRINRPDAWTELFYGRPEFPAAWEAREASQEALWAQRPQTLAEETARVFGPQATFGASITHGMVKYRRDRPFPEPIQTGYRMMLARDEYESFQVPIAALATPLRAARVSVQWEGPGPHPEVVLRPVGYVETKPDPDNLAEYVGWWPDPLMPPGPVDVAPWETQPIWGTVHATADTPAGVHEAIVTVRAEGQPAVRLRLTARVLDFNLGFTNLPSLLSLRLQSIRQFYRMDEVDQETKRRWYEFCLQYRMNPNDIYAAEFIPEEEDLAFCIERGFNAMVITTPALRRITRNSAENLQVWVSDDNVNFRQIPEGYTVTHDDQGSIVVGGLDVTARYFKLHSTLADSAYEFSLKTLEEDRIMAYDGDQAYTGPAAYVGTEDGTKPLLSFGALWGAALDLNRSSLGVDLGEPRRVDRLVLRGAYQDTLERIRRFYEVAEAHGMGDRAYVYGFDEWADVSRYGDIKSTYDEIKAIAPGIKASSTVVYPVPPIDETIDAWCPAVCYEYPEYRQARERGQEVWYYAGGTPYDPYPTHELLDVPAVEARAFFWIAWRYQYTGWLHWELNVWMQNMSGDQRWPEVPWDPARSGIRNGEVGRIYPGPDATPLPSVRLENMRDGIEDYDYLWLLREHARGMPEGSRQRVAVERLIDETIIALSPSRAHFERDPDTVLAHRERLGLTLERLNRR